MGGFCQLVELHRERSAPAACAAGLFLQVSKLSWLPLVVLIKSSAFWLDRVPFA